MAKQTFTTGSVLTATQMNNLQANDYNWTVSQKTASYVLVAADAGTRIEMNTASNTTVTVNTGLFTAGDTLFIQNIGSGSCVITAGTATVQKSANASLTLSQYQGGYLYFISASNAVFFADAGFTSPLTTKGDLFTWDTGNARLAVGTNGQYLSADSTAATGLKWATISTGAWTQLETGSLSGASVTTGTLSGSYRNLRVIVTDWYPATDDANLRMRVNGDTGNNYFSNMNIGQSGMATGSYDAITLSLGCDNGSGAYSYMEGYWFDYANTSHRKTWQSPVSVTRNATTGTQMNGFTNYGGLWFSTNAITTITFLLSSGNFNGGTYIIYGGN